MLGWEVIPRIGFGRFTVSPHGVGIAFGCLVGAWVMARRCRARGVDEAHAWNVAAWGVAGAILGARIAYIVGHADEFTSPLQWLQIWQGGISLIGGLLGGVAFAYVYARRERADFFELGDLGAPGLAVGVGLGRTGDLVIGDHLGKETSGWWGWTYKGGELISPPPCFTGTGAPVYSTPDGCIVPGITVHQTALYDMLWALAIFGILLLIDRRPHRRGFLFLSWATLYALGRVVTDFLRVDKRWVVDLTGSQLTSLAVIAVCLFLLVRYRGAPPRRTAAVPDRPKESAGGDIDGASGEGSEEVDVAASEAPAGRSPDPPDGAS